MYKNQLQELAQRSCFNLPSYTCIRQGPDHAPRFKASVNFNGEIFESPTYSTTLRQAEHAAAGVALNSLSARGPSNSLTARVLDETGVYKNLLQEAAHRAGLKLPLYTTIRSGPGHVPVFTSTVELAGLSFDGEPAKTKKQAEKNAAITAWSAFKKMPNFGPLSGVSKEMDESRVVRKRDHLKTNNPTRIRNPVLGSERQILENNSNSFLCLLPPPHPRTASKILPPNLSESKDGGTRDDEWMKKISDAIIKKKQNNLSRNSSSSIFYSRPFDFDPTQIANKQPVRCSDIGRSYHAPAVQMRSVVPVCAAPPPQPVKVIPLIPSPNSNSTDVKETGTSSSTAELKL